MKKSYANAVNIREKRLKELQEMILELSVYFPKDIIVLLSEAKEKLTSVNLEHIKKDLESSFVKLEGDCLSIEKIKSSIEKVTRFNDWREEQRDSEDGWSPEFQLKILENNYSYTCDVSKIKRFEFMRDARNRNDLDYIEVLTVPGHFIISVENGRVSFSLPQDGLGENSCFVNELEKV